MKKNDSLSIRLSLGCVIFFSVLLLAADLTALKWITVYADWRGITSETFRVLLCVVFYAASAAGWLCLWMLWKLLKSISAGGVFVMDNVNYLHRISLCCCAAAVIFIFGGFLYAPVFIPGAAAGFMMLIVNVVESVFRRAVLMQDELDLTI